MNREKLARIWTRLDKRMERLVMHPPRGSATLAWRLRIAVLLLIATIARALIGPYPLVDLFVVPVLLRIRQLAWCPCGQMPGLVNLLD